MKYCCFFVFVFLLSACGEGGGSSDSEISNDYSEALYLNGHSLNDIFKLKNDSLWIIVGLSTNDGVISEGEKDVIIYNNPNDFGEPDQGVRGQYYVFINNSSDSFYIDPVSPPRTLQEGNVALATLALGAVVVLDDDSVWKVQGIDSSTFSGSSFFDYTLYDINEDFPNLTSQPTETLSDWYLYNEEAPFGYYLEPVIDARIQWEGTHTFYLEGVSDSILLSDGSLWLITGTLSSAATPSGEYSIKLIKNVASLDEPSTGVRTETILYLQGHETTFYVKKI
ncbi:hypothetical protein [Colwellia psychrerythraea]|uniref:Lipoprotein n=1 Tax=Colwellia psychrerythraea TaxID=28229 RepID=A0A099KET6_COLPS|nr:hypothetical protein [Colwellia psychrerythraea]KGJ88881.1 hypothetical protein ND2E_0174 [Colwellia psychrerythraea]